MVNVSPSARLTALERQALLHAISSIKVEAWREAFMRQVNALHVKCRTEKTTGYYVDFEIPEQLRVTDLSNDFNKTPPQAEARHPDGVNAIFFIVYINAGLLSFMEAASTSDWPKNEGGITFIG